MQIFHYQLTSVFLTNQVLSPPDKRKYIKKIQDKALTASACIWQSHRVTTIQQVWWYCELQLGRYGLVLMLLRSQNHALNSESSSDEGFVGSNAVV